MRHAITIALLTALLAGAGLGGETRREPPFEITVAPVGANNLRNSEAAIVPLKNGSLLLAWTEFYANSGADHGPAQVVPGGAHDLEQLREL